MEKISIKAIILIVLFVVPFNTFAWNSNDSDITIINELNSLTQPKGKTEIKQGSMTAKYIPNNKALTDKIILNINGKSRILPGPWSVANKSFREKVRKCMKDNGLGASECGFYDYKIIRLSPSGNYLELSGTGWESGMWRLIDTKTGKIVLSNDNGVEKSSWSSDRKSISFKTFFCDIGGCTDKNGYLMTIPEKFPKLRQLEE